MQTAYWQPGGREKEGGEEGRGERREEVRGKRGDKERGEVPAC